MTPASTDTSPAPVVLVTGARRGIGRAVAVRFLREGWRTALNDIETDELRHTVHEIARERGIASAHPADISDAEQATALIGEVIATYGRLDALVNNAALIRFGSALEYSGEDLVASLGTNVLGALFCTQAAARHWVEAGGGGSVVMVSSVSARQARKGHLGYAASKAAMEMMARVAALELAEHGIRVNCVAPGGPILTEFVVEHAASRTGFDERIRTTVPMQRTGTAGEVADVVYYLCSEHASYVTGSTVVVDGGVSIGRP